MYFRVVAALPLKRRGAFMVSLLALRGGEIRALDVADFHPDVGEHGALLVAKAVKGPNFGAPIRGPKSRRARMAPVDAALRAWIDEHRAGAAPDAQLFINPTARTADKRWLSNSLREEWNRAEKRAGLRHVRMYEGSRHSSATAALAGACPWM